ncbi:unnamed protein product [Lactuca virosa]|uniref:Wax synthase domain-containing protein n=1 Tax=Lactuca virosa TaxID=75947 RepID=A0AAU9MAH6_9ASTR|nr:unnamed protein product [Lactuca virosa]
MIELELSLNRGEEKRELPMTTITYMKRAKRSQFCGFDGQWCGGSDDGKIVRKGVLRFLSILPVVLVFLFIPLTLTSVHMIGAFSFYISWLANFKLILFAFEKGPLSTPSITLLRFLAVACFPIDVTQSDKGFSKPNKTSLFTYGTKGLVLAICLHLYHHHKEDVHPMMAWCVFGLIVYLMLELFVALSSTIVGLFLKVELDQQFDEPYLATSLQDFWGRRWNVMVNRILHPSVYEPMRILSIRVVGRLWAPVPAILTTFLVSGIMHELIFFYFTREWPTGEVMLFFALHGVCLVLEVVIKKATRYKWSLPNQLSRPLVLTFVLATSYWLFLPELSRCNMIERAFEDYVAVSELATDVVRTTPVFFK